LGTGRCRFWREEAFVVADVYVVTPGVVCDFGKEGLPHIWNSKNAAKKVLSLPALHSSRAASVLPVSTKVESRSNDHSTWKR